MEERGGSALDRRAAATWQNRVAGIVLRAARSSVGQTQGAFAQALSDRMGYAITYQALSGYERGKRTVPGAVVLMAAMLAEKTVEELAGAARDGHHELDRWLAGVEAAQERDQELRLEVGRLADEMAEIRDFLNLPRRGGLDQNRQATVPGARRRLKT